MSAVSQRIDKQSLKTLSEPNLHYWTKDLILDWLILMLVISSAYFFPNPFTVILCLLVVGNRQHALAILGHEGTHYRISHNRKLNDFLSNILCFWPLGLTASGYRILHNKHHRNTGTEHDPELAHKRSRSPQWDLPASPSRILKYAFLDIIGLSLPDYWIIVSYSKPEKNTEYVPLALWHIVFLSTCLITGFWWVALLWYICLVTTFMMSFRLRLWLEHQGTSETHRLHLTPLQAAILAPHNIWLHWEHHKYVSIPYFNLPKVREGIQGSPIMKLDDLITFFRTAPQSKSGEI